MISKQGFKMITALLIIIMLNTGCRKFVEVEPPATQITGATVYASDATATSVINGIYSRMMISYPGFANGAITLYSGLSADEFINYPVTPQAEFYANAINPNNSYLMSLWSEIFQYIYTANAIIEGVQSSSAISKPVHDELLGESCFIRAFCNFYLVNLFGDMPYITTTSYQTNNNIGRLPVAKDYKLMITDLLEADSLLLKDYSASGGERVRPNQFAAKALLARVYLYTGDWVDAESEASQVIGRTDLFSLDSNVNDVFLANSNETIWQLEPVSPGLNTAEGNRFILTGVPNSVSLSPQIVNAFEPGDQRRSNWIDSIVLNAATYYYPYKYKIKTGAPITEYYMVFRLAEQYLIRAEARAMQNNIQGATADLNSIRSRAGLSNTFSIDQQSLLQAILQERKVELFAEWGNRWLDLKRTGNADSVLAVLKPAWKNTAVLYPIPIAQLQSDPNFSQNSGY